MGNLQLYNKSLCIKSLSSDAILIKSMIMGPCPPGTHFTKQTIFVIKSSEPFCPFVFIKHDRENHSARSLLFTFWRHLCFYCGRNFGRVIDGPCVESDGFIELINILNNVWIQQTTCWLSKQWTLFKPFMNRSPAQAQARSTPSGGKDERKAKVHSLDQMPLLIVLKLDIISVL